MEPGNKAASLSTRHFAWALCLYVLWTVATYLLEGRILTLLRPQAAVDRLVYAIVANVGIGLVLAGVYIGYATRTGPISPAYFGFRPRGRTAVSLLLGSVLGFAVFLFQRPPSLDPLVLLNGFAQVWVVSSAEVLVCWAVLGTTSLAIGARVGRRTGLSVAWLTSALTFGVYHFAHSPPFQTFRMVALLTIVGLATGLFFYTLREVYGTIVFHNFLALAGVSRALSETNRLETYQTLHLPLLFMALVSIIVLMMVHLFLNKTRKKPD